jgi:MarR family transcriptional regulator, organic hydroperoxide resistance regulator
MSEECDAVSEPREAPKPTSSSKTRFFTEDNPSGRKQSLSDRFRGINKLFSQARYFALRKNGVTEGQWNILRELWDRDGISQRQIGDQLQMSSAATVYAVNMLEKDNLAKRVKDPGDRRSYRIVLTKEGRKLRNALLPVGWDYQMIALNGFTDDELEQLDNMLERIRSNLEDVIKKRRKEGNEKVTASRRARQVSTSGQPDLPGNPKTKGNHSGRTAERELN